VNELIITVTGRLDSPDEVAEALTRLAERIREDDDVFSPIRYPMAGKLRDSQGNVMGTVEAR